MSEVVIDWETLYQQGDTGWDRGEASPALLQWLNDGILGQGDHVLIPGCGRGHEVLALAGRGYSVTGIDFAPSAITALNQCLNKAGTAVNSQGICVDLFAYEAGAKFDIIYEQTCLCTMTSAEYQAYEKKLYGWLNDGGVLLLLLMQTGEAGGPPFHCDLMEMRQLFDPLRWSWLTAAPLLVPRPKGPRFELGFVLTRKN